MVAAFGAPASAQRRRAVTAVVIGIVVERYELALYGVGSFVVVLKFTTLREQINWILPASVTFVLFIVARMAGAFVIGRMGDTQGRKRGLIALIYLAAAGALLMGVLPTNTSMGFIAPPLLLLARLVQSFAGGSALGISTSLIVEWAPPGRRGFYGGFLEGIRTFGDFLPAAIVALLYWLLSPESMLGWGWRIPFLLGALLGLVGIYMLREIDETPAYSKAVTERAVPMLSRLAIGACGLCFVTAWSASSYILLTYIWTWVARHMKLDAHVASQTLWLAIVGGAVVVAAAPAMGYLSDRWGRRPLLLACCASFIVLPWPIFAYVTSGSASFTLMLAIQVAFALLVSIFSGAGPAALAEMFPTRSRATLMAVSYTLAAAIVDGFTGYFEAPTANSLFLVAMAALSLVVILRLKETAFEELA